MASARARDDVPGALAGDAGAVRDAFEQMPARSCWRWTGPDHRIVATNAAYRAFTGRSDVIGMSYREAFPEIERAAAL